MRYFVELSYNGGRYCGWQRQRDAASVQETLERALSTLLREPVEVTGAGRTDTGVHAAYAVAHFDVAAPLTDPEHTAYKLNCLLPDDVAVFGQHDVLRIDAGLDGDHAVGHQVAVFAVDRHGALRLDDVVHVQQLAFVAVAGDVHGGVVSVDHAGSELHELVDDLVDAMLVTWGRRR